MDDCCPFGLAERGAPPAPPRAGRAPALPAPLEVRGSLVEDGRDLTLDRTESEAGVRVVGVPAVSVPEVRRHLDEHAEAGPNGRAFVGPKGATPRRSTFNRAWSAALARAEATGTAMPQGLHFHDLRRTGSRPVQRASRN